MSGAAALLTLLALGRIPSRHPGHGRGAPHLRAGPAHAAEYELLFDEFVTLYKQTKGIFKRLNRF